MSCIASGGRRARLAANVRLQPVTSASRVLITAGLMLSSTVVAQPLEGSISGTLGFPSEDIPPLRVCAISITESAKSRCVRTKPNQSKYRITKLSPGTYFLVVYPKSNSIRASNRPGGYTKAVRCGLHARCDDHSLIPIEVRAGSSVRETDPTDFYASASAFPKEPPE